MSNFDYSRVDVLDFLEELGIRNIQDKGDEVFYSCPFPGHSNDDSHPSASMKQGSTMAYCFGCGWRGNALRFLADYEGVPPLTALKWLRERFGSDFKEPEGKVVDEIDSILFRETRESSKNTRIIAEHECERREVNWSEVFCEWEQTENSPWPLSYMLDRGFSPEILLDFKIGFDFISQRIVIPYRLPDGGLLGFKARAIADEQEPRYMVLGGPEYGFEPFSVGETLFGLDQAIKAQSFKTRKHLFVCEGELNCVAMHDKGWDNCAGVSGKYLSDKQTMQIVKYASSATFIFDDIEDSIKAALKLNGYMPVYVVDDHDIDPADAPRDYLEALIATASSPLSRALVL